MFNPYYTKVYCTWLVTLFETLPSAHSDKFFLRKIQINLVTFTLRTISFLLQVKVIRIHMLFVEVLLCHSIYIFAAVIFLANFWPNYLNMMNKLTIFPLVNHPTKQFMIIMLTHFSPISHFYAPWKRQKTICLTLGFLTFPVSIEMWHSTKMGL